MFRAGQNFHHSVSNLEADKMQTQIFSKLSLALAATLLLLSGPAAQAGPIEDRPAVATVQFRSLFDNSVCTGYQVFNNLFVTEARCLDTEAR